VVTQILVIGIGNGFRSDDGAGLVAARRLKEQSSSSFRVLEHNGEGADLMESWEGADAVFLLDAVRSGAPPGTVHRWDAGLRHLPAAAFHGSTHAFSLAEAIEMARVLGRLPQHVVVYGIEGRNFKAGTRLSSEVQGGVSRLVRRVLLEVQQLSKQERSTKKLRTTGIAMLES
jgi:hydrogenase maturation protease